VRIAHTAATGNNDDVGMDCQGTPHGHQDVLVSSAILAGTRQQEEAMKVNETKNRPRPGVNVRPVGVNSLF